MSPAVEVAFWRRGRVVPRFFNDLHGDSTTYKKVASLRSTDSRGRLSPDSLGQKLVLVTEGGYALRPFRL
jgi:hypothetical protein